MSFRSTKSVDFSFYVLSFCISFFDISQAFASQSFDEELGETEVKSEMVVEVKAKKNLIRKKSSVTSVQVDRQMIERLPQGDQIRLPKLLAVTTPGVVLGAFGQVFVRNNHGSVQYRIDGVQLPDSPSNSFGDAFSPRNIDHLEVMTGGIPAEFGERVAAVVDIATKSGPEIPGGNLELNYGTFNRVSPQLTYGGSNSDGSLHYFFSANYFRTDRGLDTPQPLSTTDQTQGGPETVHNFANGNNQFLKLDWLAGNQDKVSFTFFNSYAFNQIPNYPARFSPRDSFFTQTDPFGNEGFNYTPSTTDDFQFERTDFLQVAWRHTFSPQSFLQVSPYYQYSQLVVSNDPANDLIASNPNVENVASFSQNRHVNHLGLKADYSLRADDRNLIKSGFQLQVSQASGSVNIITQNTNFSYSDPNTGYFESAYVQDSYTLFEPLTLNAGIRLSATQFNFSGLTTSDYLFQPRVGLVYVPFEDTKFHLFYGKLFMPSPVENLRVAYNKLKTPGTTLTPYDVKAEKDDYFEFGVSQQFFETQLAKLNLYYKDSVNMLDEAQLLNTSISQPFNLAEGYAYGVEVSVAGKLFGDWSEFLNYSYQIARGRGLGGGIFAFSPGQGPESDYQMLDHVQVHTLNSGLTYAKNGFWGTLQVLYGSGLRTGPGNSKSLPPHITLDSTIGYEFSGKSWLSQWKASFDVLNMLDNAYPVTIANGFNGSHYAAGREFVLHLSKNL